MIQYKIPQDIIKTLYPQYNKQRIQAGNIILENSHTLEKLTVTYPEIFEKIWDWIESNGYTVYYAHTGRAMAREFQLRNTETMVIEFSENANQDRYIPLFHGATWLLKKLESK